MSMFKVFRGILDKRFYYRLRADNTELILSWEGYATKENCLEGIEIVRRCALEPENFERIDASFNYSFFLLKGVNGEIIGKSENYLTPSAREAGIITVLRQASEASLKDFS